MCWFSRRPSCLGFNDRRNISKGQNYSKREGLQTQSPEIGELEKPEVDIYYITTQQWQEGTEKKQVMLSSLNGHMGECEIQLEGVLNTCYSPADDLRMILVGSAHSEEGTKSNLLLTLITFFK